MGIQLQVAPPVVVNMDPDAPLPVYTPNPSFQDIQFSSHPRPTVVTIAAEDPEPAEPVTRHLPPSSPTLTSVSIPSPTTIFNTGSLSSTRPQTASPVTSDKAAPPVTVIDMPSSILPVYQEFSKHPRPNVSMTIPDSER
ncbi:hypothetical protein BGZ89_001740 [Linnemannia elongata]|nr:hypothetical protein BGZ89_001740 [Linnemannia elongata]